MCRRSEGNEIFVTIHFHLQGLGDEPSPSPTPSAPPHSASLTHSASWESLSTLPTNGSPLRHVTHVRPRPPRRHRAVHLPPESVSRSCGMAAIFSELLWAEGWVYFDLCMKLSFHWAFGATGYFDPVLNSTARSSVHFPFHKSIKEVRRKTQHV